MRNQKLIMKELAGKILMIVENSYPQDTRVRNEATKLSTAGYKVIVISKKYSGQNGKELISGITVFRIPWFEVFKKTSQSNIKLFNKIHRMGTKAGYIVEYFYFTLSSFIYSLYISLSDGFDVVHIHNPPNTLFPIGLFYRLLGKKFVFDHHDLSPELFLSRYNLSKGIIYKALLFEEKLCLRSANIVIATNESYKAIDIERGNKNPEDVFIVRNGPDLQKFKLVEPIKDTKYLNKKIFVYVGEMGPQDGVDYLLKSLYTLVNKFNRRDFFCFIIGKGDAVPELIKLKDELKLNDFVFFTGHIPFKDLLSYLSTADICLDPNPSNPLNDKSTWIKIMEYMSLGKPIISFDLKETRFSAQKAAIYAKPNDIDDYASKINILMDDQNLRAEMGEFGRQRVESKLSWNIVSENLLIAYNKLLSKR